MCILPLAHLKNACGLFNLMRNLGGVIGLAGIGTGMDRRSDLHFARLADHLNPGRPEVQAYLDRLSARYGDLIAADPALAATETLGSLLHREAALMAFNDVFLLMALVFFASLLVMPFVHKPRPAPLAGILLPRGRHPGKNDSIPE